MNRRSFLRMLGAGVAVAASLRLSHVPELMSEDIEPTSVLVRGVGENTRVTVYDEYGDTLFSEVTPEGWKEWHQIGFETSYRGEVKIVTSKVVPFGAALVKQEGTTVEYDKADLDALTIWRGELDDSPLSLQAYIPHDFRVGVGPQPGAMKA